MKNQATPVVTKESKNKIRVDYEGKLSFTQRMKEKFKSSQTWTKIAINIFRFVLMLGVSFVIIYPFISKFANSIMSQSDVIDKTVSLVPRNPTLEIYQALFTENRYMEAFTNTLVLSLMCAVVQMLVACLVGYGLAKFKFKGNKILMGLVVVTMIIPHSTLALSMVRHFNSFDLLTMETLPYKGIFEMMTGSTLELGNTYAPLVILSIGGIAFKNGLYIYLMRQFFKGVPDELEESAYVDGCGTVRTFFQIILPLAVPMMITVFLFSFSWQWTDGFYTADPFFERGGFDLYDPASNQRPVLMPDFCSETPPSLIEDSPYFSANSGDNTYDNIVKNTAGLMIIAPLVVLYLFCQRYLVQGIERSGITG